MNKSVKAKRAINNYAMRRMEETVDEVVVQFSYIATLTTKAIAVRYARSVLSRLEARVIEAIETPEEPSE